MRALYTVVGILLGVLFTTKQAQQVISVIERENMNMVTSFTLVGYYEGWQRGRHHTERRLLGHLHQCYQMYKSAESRCK